MTFYETLDSIMKQDFGGRGLLASLPASPLAAVSASLAHAKRAVLLTGFPVRMPDGSITGETDGPSGTANLAAALTAAGCRVSVVTDWSSYPHLEAALRFRAPQATLIRLPEQNTDNFIRTFIRDAKPTHLISLERPGKAENGHYHSMRGEQLDDMITDSALFLPENLVPRSFPSEMAATRWEWGPSAVKFSQVFHTANLSAPQKQLT